MQQQARFKSLGNFESLAKTLLLLTDVAERGLDIPLVVDYVIHHQVLWTVDCYVHWSG